LVGVNLVDIVGSSDTILMVDRDLMIRRHNRTHIDFACANGEPDIESRHGIGSALLSAFTEPVRSFYERAFGHVLANGEVFHQSYDCSAPGEYRAFRLSAYPIAQDKGLLLCHHLVVAAPIPLGEMVIRLAAHLSPDHFIVQCCHCRKVENFEYEKRWDWVPDLVEHQAVNISHTFCPRCLDHYYPDNENA
jgi:hypothetical protein